MKRLINEGWRFASLAPGKSIEEARAGAQQAVTLPHDFALHEPDRFYADRDGWYFRVIDGRTLDRGCKHLVRFDGVYMDAAVYLNGRQVCEHHYGYTAFDVPLDGPEYDGPNELAVQVRYMNPNSRWYSGAGIFRDVTLVSLPETHFVPDGLCVGTAQGADGAWTVTVRQEVRAADGTAVRAALYDSGETVVSADACVRDGLVLCDLRVEHGRPWSPDDPYLYGLTLSLPSDEVSVRVGLRQTRFTTDQGFYLNGVHMKLKGVCLHHDLGALGAAFHEDAARRQLMLMKDMGVNAVRTAHNPPAARFLDLCDELGLMVMDELYDMWALPKTTYDNARFFRDTWREDVAAWVRRDRWHPSVILLSIGNEIQDMHVSEEGRTWTRLLSEEARAHDPLGHMAVTFGSNYMPWEGAQACADIIKLPGYNYAESWYRDHHEKHKDWVIFGSETGSLVQSRAVYHFPMREDILSDEDLQCSALLNAKTSWGHQSLPVMLTEDLKTPYSLGQFVWSGIDYIGEPTPYHTRSSYFGHADTACYPKDSYYFFKAMWTDSPMAHIGVYWRFNMGQMIDVPVMTNCASVELVLNGRSLGIRTVDRLDPARCLPVYTVPYEPGELCAVGRSPDGKVLATDVVRTFGEPERLCLTPEQGTVRAGGLAFVTVTALDEKGVTVENAVDRIHVTVSEGRLMGVDNGDSADRDGYQTDSRCLFGGRLLLMLGADRGTRAIRVRVSARGLTDAELAIPVSGSEERPLPTVCIAPGETDGPVMARRVDIAALDGQTLTPDKNDLRFRIRTEPAAASDQLLGLRVTTAQGVDHPAATVRMGEDGLAHVSALGDGEFYLRVTACNGYPHTRVISVLELRAEGFGPVSLDPYHLVYASLYDLSAGQIAPGNDRGIAFDREGSSYVGFSRVDFGRAGSDRLTLPIFALDGREYLIDLWDGVPDRGGEKLMTLTYQKPSIWNTYQDETWQLPRLLRGVHTLCFGMTEKVHLKGFVFERSLRPFRINHAGEADEIYGDSFRRDGAAVMDIGNNVTLSFDEMDFGPGGRFTLLLSGYTAHDSVPVMVRFSDGTGQDRTVTCPFVHRDRPDVQAFKVDAPAGVVRVSFVFLPGSHFDFGSFIFREAGADGV